MPDHTHHAALRSPAHWQSVTTTCDVSNLNKNLLASSQNLSCIRCTWPLGLPRSQNVSNNVCKQLEIMKNVPRYIYLTCEIKCLMPSCCGVWSCTAKVDFSLALSSLLQIPPTHRNKNQVGQKELFVISNCDPIETLAKPAT